MREYEDDGSKESSDRWFKGFYCLAPPSGLEVLIDVRERLAHDDEFAGDLEARITNELLGKLSIASVGGARHLELPQCFAIEEPDRYICEGVGNQPWVLIRASMQFRAMGRTDVALAHLSRALESIGLQVGDMGMQQAFVGLERASCFQRLGRNADANRELGGVYRALQSWKPKSELLVGWRLEVIATTRLAIVRQWCNSGRYERALSEIRALRKAEQEPRVASQLHYYEAVALRALAEASSEEIESCLDRALEANSLAANVRGMATLEQAAHFIDVGKRVEARQSLAAHRELRAAHPGSWPLQRIRAIALDARLARLEGRSRTELVARAVEVRAAYRDFLNVWRESADGLAVGTLAFVERRILVGELIELTLLETPGPKGVEAALEEVFAARANGALARSLGARQPTLADLRREVLTSERDGLIVLLPSAEHTHLFAVDRGKSQHVRLPSLEALGPAIDELWRLLAMPPTGPGASGAKEFSASAASLGREVFPEPIAELLRRWKRVHVVGTDLLQRLPLEVLEVEGIGVLGLERQLVNLPSVAVGLALAERGQAPSEAKPSLRALVGPQAARGVRELSPVEFDEKARDLLEQSFEGDRLIWHTGAEAVLEWSPDEARATALLLFAHGERDSSRTRPLGVRVAPSSGVPDGRLFPDVLEALEGDGVSELVVLAACGVGGAEQKAGSDDGDHLGAAFLRRGARLTLISAAPLEQRATAWLCAWFFEGIAEGKSPSEALRLARRQLRATEGFAHPHYWGTLVPFGWDGVGEEDR